MHDPDTHVTFESESDLAKALASGILPVYEAYETTLSFDRKNDAQAIEMRGQLAAIGVKAVFSDVFSGEDILPREERQVRPIEANSFHVVEDTVTRTGAVAHFDGKEWRLPGSAEAFADDKFRSRFRLAQEIRVPDVGAGIFGRWRAEYASRI